MGEIFNLDDMIKKEIIPKRVCRYFTGTGRNHSVIFGYSRRISPRYDWSN